MNWQLLFLHGLSPISVLLFELLVTFDASNDSPSRFTSNTQPPALVPGPSSNVYPTRYVWSSTFLAFQPYILRVPFLASSQFCIVSAVNEVLPLGEYTLARVIASSSGVVEALRSACSLISMLKP